MTASSVTIQGRLNQRKISENMGQDSIFLPILDVRRFQCCRYTFPDPKHILEAAKRPTQTTSYVGCDQVVACQPNTIYGAVGTPGLATPVRTETAG